MSSPAPSAAYREAAAWITPGDLSTYLAATRRWRLEDRQDDLREVWALQGEDGRVRARIMLPLAADYADFDDRFSDAIAAVGLVNDWEPSELADRLLAISADLMHLRLGLTGTSETISLRRAATTVSVIYEMIAAAAVSAALEAGDDDLSISDVTTFLNEDLRLAHTRPGSFVFTVVAQQSQTSATNPTDGAGRGVPFSRRVMQALAADLETAYERTKTGDLHALGRIALDPLRRLVGSGDVTSIEFSFGWAAVMPPPQVGAAPLRLDLEDMQKLRSRIDVSRTERGPDVVAERSIKVLREQGLAEVREEPEVLPRVTLTGHVVELRLRSSAHGNLSGSVLLEGQTSDGQSRKVRVSLTGDAYRLAIDAHTRIAPLVITGDLIVRPRISRLVGDLEIDGRYIQ